MNKLLREKEEALREKQEELKRLLTEREVDNDYGLSKPWLRKRRGRHEPPNYVKIGRSVFYRRSDIEEFIEQNVVKTAQLGGRNGQ